MIKKKISQLPAASALDGTELIEVVQGGVNKKATAQGIVDLGSAGGGGVKYYTANITQSGGLPPNEDAKFHSFLADPVWVYFAAGQYRLTSPEFTLGKTFVLHSLGGGAIGSSPAIANVYVNADFGGLSDAVYVETFGGVNSAVVKMTIYVLVYP